MDELDRHVLTLEALAEVDEAKVIEHQLIVAWADSLSTDDQLPLPVER